MTSGIRTARHLSEAKRTGAHFTPPALADFVADRILHALPAQTLTGGIEVLDPSCGDGELLRAFIEATPARAREAVKLVGVEDNDKSLAETRERLEADHANHELLRADFLDVSDTFTQSLNFSPLLFDAPATNHKLTQPDVIIANPPYVRTQVLGAERAQQLAAKFNLKGRVDLYHAFLVAMTEVLREGGYLGVITSNRFLATKGGESVRAFLHERYDIVEIIDLGDTKLFSAAVLPAVIIAQKRKAKAKPSATKPRFVKVYEDLEPGPEPAVPTPVADILHVLEAEKDGRYQVGERVFQVTSGTLAFGATPREPWRMTSGIETAWTERVESSTALRIADLVKVRVGIKTTADSIFIRDDWHALPTDLRPEPELLRPLFTHFDAERWQPNKPAGELLRILYPHENVDGKRRAIDVSRFPHARNYLESQRESLEGRKYVIEAGRKWYEIWVPQDPAAWAQPKIVWPDISVEPRFFFDASGALVNGDCYWIAVEEARTDLLYLIQGVANSSIMVRYHDLAFNNKLYSGRRRFISQYVERYPIPAPDSPGARVIVATAKELNDTADEQQRAALEQRLDEAVAAAFGVTP